MAPRPSDRPSFEGAPPGRGSAVGRSRWRETLLGTLVGDLLRPVGASARLGAGEGVRPLAVEYALAVVAVVAAVLLGRAMSPAFESADIVMAFLLAVVVVSFGLRRGPSTVAALLSTAAFDFFFVPPYYTFAVLDVRHVVTFGTMMLVAFVVSGLAHRVRGQAESARERERHTAALYAASRDFAGTTGLDAIARAAARHVGAVFGGEALVLLPDGAGGLAPRPADATASFWGEAGREAAAQAFAGGHLSGREGRGAGERGEGQVASYVPLRASRGAVGVLAVRAPPGGAGRLLEAFASLSALALERALLVEEAQRAQLAVERERVLNTLLSSVSHDLRTPLASIMGSASTMLDGGEALPAPMRKDLAETIHEEAARLNRLVANLLDMTRLSAGVVAAKKEWQPLEEVVGSALARLEAQLGGRRVDVRLPDDLPLVPIDAVLVEQVLINLLENVLKHTPAGTPVALSAAEVAGEVVVRVDDEGPGVPVPDAGRVFDTFYRGSSGVAGAGLGLAICRGVVAAHGGRIWVEPRIGPGASFRFALPLEGGPPPLAPDDAPAEPEGP